VRWAAASAAETDKILVSGSELGINSSSSPTLAHTGKESGYAHRSLRPDAVRHMSVAAAAHSQLADPVEALGVIPDRPLPCWAGVRSPISTAAAGSATTAAARCRQPLATYLGHHDPGFTLRAYVHLMPDAADRMRLVVDRALSTEADGPGTARVSVSAGQR
jgi:hypothetical protein